MMRHENLSRRQNGDTREGGKAQTSGSRLHSAINR